MRAEPRLPRLLKQLLHAQTQVRLRLPRGCHSLRADKRSITAQLAESAAFPSIADGSTGVLESEHTAEGLD